MPRWTKAKLEDSKFCSPCYCWVAKSAWKRHLAKYKCHDIPALIINGEIVHDKIEVRA